MTAVVRISDAFEEEAVRADLRARLAGYKLPKRIVTTEASLRAPNGKADYDAAKKIAGESS